MNQKMIIGIVAIIIVVAGVGIYSSNSSKTEMMEKEVMMQENKDVMMIEGSDLDAIFAKAPSITLKDVSKSGATGVAWVAVYDGKTYHRVIAKNMPALPGADFYEGWLVKSAITGDFFSTGKMNYNVASKEATLDFVTDGDKSDYRFVVITSEPDDGNPKPDKHIIEERFGPNVNLNVAMEAMVVKEEPAMVEPDGAMMQKEEGAMMVKAGSYEVYEASKIAMASATHDVVLFFRASWCPMCRALNADITAHLKDIPANLTILDVDYDNSVDLKKKYGVTYQHTLVQVDAQGNLIKKWSGSPTLSSLVSEVK